MDFIDGLPFSKEKSTLLVVVGRLSKYAYFLLVTHPYIALGIAQFFFNSVFKLPGMPQTIVCG
uniref:Uncharacterized protein n=1 Tax=Rhizophora mucronata TaxID=61149 RepID=A0A2P2JQV9_RHIMU